MNIQEREEMDYQMGMASEQQNALTVSRLTQKPDDRFKIDELVAAGRFCVIEDVIAYCPITDAIMGNRLYLVSDHATLAEANAAVSPEGDFEAYQRVVGPMPVIE